MSNASNQMLEACNHLFSDRAATSAKVKSLTLTLISSNSAASLRAVETRAALDWVYECIISDNGAGNEKRISQSEDLSMRELQRPPSSANDTQTQAIARYVLAVIAHMRGDKAICASNTAHIAVAAPRWFRLEFDTIFREVFRPECQGAYDQLKSETDDVLAKTYRTRVIAKRAAALAVGTGVGVAVASGLVLAGLRNGTAATVRVAALGVAKPIWIAATSEKARAFDLTRVNARFEDRLDNECRTVARRYI